MKFNQRNPRMCPALFIAASMVVGCSASRPHAPPSRPALAQLALASLTLPARSESGGVMVSIIWPLYMAQKIPDATTRILISAFSGKDASIRHGDLAIARPMGVAETTAQMTGLPPGEVVLSAQAQDASGKAIAAGSTTVVIFPNEVAGARLTLSSLDKPTVTAIFPVNGLPGRLVSVLGSGFGASTGDPLAVTIGGVPVPAADVRRITDGLLSFSVPLGATTSAIAVRVGTNTGTSGGLFTTIATFSLSPAATETFVPFGLIPFRLDAKDAVGVTVPKPEIPLTVVSQTCTDGPCLAPPIVVGSDLVLGNQPGLLLVSAGTASLAVVAQVRAHPLTTADLPPGMGPLGPLPVPADNAMSAARVALGKKLFFDSALSGSGKMSCATCHVADKGWGDAQSFATGNDGLPLGRNAPTVLNAAYFPALFWDGRAPSLEAQALGVIEAGREFNSDKTKLVAHATQQYGTEFQATYGAAPTVDLVTKALATFERTIVSPPNVAAFDRWASGNSAALSTAQFRGLGRFLGKGQCASCHSGALFSDGKFHNIGVKGSGTTDLGRKAIDPTAVAGAFKTPTLRNVALSGPYFHDGSKLTLFDAIKHYEDVDLNFPNLSPLFRRIGGDDVPDLEEFMQALTATPSF